ncbi:hypothetical protein OAL75_03180 [Candidatus Pelagibacter ubique]|nr:hypothetical protein [Candidatus Pelagibacter ubique]
MVLSNYSSKSKKLIIYCPLPFFNTWPKKWKLDEFKNYGFDVELWSAEEIFYKPENIKAAASGSSQYLYRDLNITKIKNLVDLNSKVAELDTKAIVCVMLLGSLKNKFDNPDLDIFNKYKIKYILHHLYPYPVVPSAWFKFKFNLRLLQKRLNNYKKKPYLIIGTGSEGRKQVSKIYKNKFIYKSVPSANVLWFKEEPIIYEKYIVYVEESVNSSPDAALFGQSNPTHDIEGFYKRINNVFDKIENWTNFKVIIAASGKYEYKNNPFKNRNIVYKKTLNLIQHSELVLGHHSSALEQAICENKPLLCFKDKGFIKIKNKMIHNLAQVYGLKSIWTNQLDENNFEKSKDVNLARNKKLINQYLKEDNIKGSFFENIISSFHQI